MTHVRAALLFRMIRAAIFAGACVGVSALGHTLAGHAKVGHTGLLLGFVAIFALATPAAGRERSLPAILAGMLVAEVGLHLLFSAYGSPHPMPATVTEQTMALSGHAPTGHAPTGHAAFTMVVAHTWAALLAAWWLHRGERAAWSLLRGFATRLLGRLLRPESRLAPATPTTRPSIRITVPHIFLMRYSVRRRGPPSRLIPPRPSAAPPRGAVAHA